MKKLIALVLILAVAGLGAFGYVKQKNNGPDALEVEAEAVEPMTIVQTVTATGRIQPSTQVNISADVSAKIVEMAVAEGDWVEKGDLLLQLDRERLQAEVEMGEASLRSANSNAELARENMVKAQKDYSRVKGLYDGDLESQAGLDSAYAGAQAEKARYQSSLDQVERARGTVKQAKDALSKTTIYAPIAGTISKLNKETGEIALGSQFTEDVIMIVSNLAGMEAQVDVDENDIVSVEVGDIATIEVDALADVKLTGQVTEIANSAKVSGSGTQNQKTEFEVKIAVTGGDAKLRPGMTTSGEVVTDTHDDALGVPIQCVAVRTLKQLEDGLEEGVELDKEAFKPDDDGFVEIVFVVVDGRATARQVKTGIQSDSHIEILEGLAAGDQVVTGNYRAISKDLQHGSLVAVKVKEGKDAATPQSSSLVANKVAG